MRTLVMALGALLIAAGAGACGGGDDARLVGPPPALPVTAVPAELGVGGGLSVTPNTTKEVANAFRSAGKQSLVKDGRVWELRLGSQLVGVLQLSSLTERVDTFDAKDRESVRREILVGGETAFDVATTPVWTAKDAGRGTYVWFGRQVLGVLQLKSTQFETDVAATELVTTLLQSKEWPELPPEAFEEDL
ncbi:MAG: hypothetical protein Q8K63_04010 [Acidimicrobiales bacterium]|nr:hypothetical protein [Acidimicrobiales bacterium]